jgi:hypothetical protein
LGDLVSGVLPIWIDAGYRFPRVYIGAYVQYGIAFVNNDKSGCGGEADFSSSDVQFGANVHYHLFPNRTLDPWGGIGIGYEFLNFSSNRLVGPEPTNGFQFFNLQLGADYKATPKLGIDPFVMFGLGQFTNCGSNCTIQDTALHEWLTFGIRGEYDINNEPQGGVPL